MLALCLFRLGPGVVSPLVGVARADRMRQERREGWWREEGQTAIRAASEASKQWKADAAIKSILLTAALAPS